MQHTTFTARTFASFVGVMAAVGFITVGLGAVDMVMVAPFGGTHLAAVGQGEVLIAALAAAMKGIVDVFSSRLAIGEGADTAATEFSELFVALLLLFVPAQLVALFIAYHVEPFLTAARQTPDLIAPISDYVYIRVLVLPILTLFFVFNEALKICGLKNFVLMNLTLGFGLNAFFNYLFLYSSLSARFGSVEFAVGLSTVATQACMAVFGGAVFLWALRRQRGFVFVWPHWTRVWRHLCDMSRAVPGTVARQLNDYAGTIVPLLFIGTLDVSTLAAAQVATKIFTIFCRIPQACLAGVFVFYGYAIGRTGRYGAATVRRLLLYYASVPTLLAALVVLAANGVLVDAFKSPDLDTRLAMLLVIAYMAYLPGYFFEQFFGECLTVHQAGGVLLWSSTLVTYIVTLPLAYHLVFVWQSPFLALASKGVATVMLAAIYLRYLNRHYWVSEEKVYA